MRPTSSAVFLKRASSFFIFGRAFRVTRTHSPRTLLKSVQVREAPRRAFKRESERGAEQMTLRPRFHALETRWRARLKERARMTAKRSSCEYIINCWTRNSERGSRSEPIQLISLPAKSNGLLMPNKPVGYHGEMALFSAPLFSVQGEPSHTSGYFLGTQFLGSLRPAWDSKQMQCRMVLIICILIIFVHLKENKNGGRR